MSNDQNDIVKTVNEKIFDVSVFASIITLFGLLGLYFYEYGYFIKLKIPTEFIHIEPIASSILIFRFFLITTTYFGLLNTIRILRVSSKLKLWGKAILIPVFLIGNGYYLLRGDLTVEFLFQNHIITLISVMGATSVLYLTASRNLYFADPTINYFAQKFGTVICPIITVCSMCCFLLYKMGYDEAKFIYSFVEDNNHKVILLRKYSDVFIYGQLDSNANIKSIIYSTESKSDTFAYNRRMKIKPIL